eukprot:7062624-Alexandrium_andersonii.AAC.1
MQPPKCRSAGYWPPRRRQEHHPASGRCALVPDVRGRPKARLSRRRARGLLATGRQRPLPSRRRGSRSKPPMSASCLEGLPR